MSEHIHTIALDGYGVYCEECPARWIRIGGHPHQFMEKAAKLQEENEEARQLLAEWDRKETEGVRRWVELQAENERLRGALEAIVRRLTLNESKAVVRDGGPLFRCLGIARAALSSGAAEGGEVEP